MGFKAIAGPPKEGILINLTVLGQINSHALFEKEFFKNSTKRNLFFQDPIFGSFDFGGPGMHQLSGKLHRSYHHSRTPSGIIFRFPIATPN